MQGKYFFHGGLDLPRCLLHWPPPAAVDNIRISTVIDTCTHHSIGNAVVTCIFATWDAFNIVCF
ncbi:hypothetical protein BDR06DRAFT_951641 [Suillus hirtellus]|nr:hypothetical protein BDR06DRAFT_951641 [Suillus hirtellus]